MTFVVTVQKGGKPKLVCSPVIVLTDLSHCYQCSSVLIGLERVNVVQRRWMLGVSIAASEVNTHCEVDLTSTHYVLQE